MANNYKEINWNEVRAAIIWKPETWKVETLCTFLKLCNFNSIVGKFKENAIDGYLFLTLAEDDEEAWGELELTNKDEQTLKYYQKELIKYNESFSNHHNKSGSKSGNNSLQLKQIFDKKTIPVEIVQSQWYQEEDSKKNEEALMTRSKKQKKSVVVPIEEKKESEENTVKIKTSKLVLVQNNNDETKTFTLNTSFLIHRENSKKSLSGSIYIDNKEISRNHAEVYYIPKSGYFFQDLKSSNHSYLKVPDNCNLTLHAGLELLMGESLVTIEKIEDKKVSLSIDLLFEKEVKYDDIDLILEFPSNSNEVFFGRNPSKKRPAVCKFTSDIDKKIEAEHAKFIKGEKNVTLEPLAKVYIKLGDEDRASHLYLLTKDMEIRLGFGEVNLKVQEVYPKRIRTKCACSNNFIAFIAFPCKHTSCSDCNKTKKSKKCRECGEEIKEVFKLIDVNNS